MKISKENMRSKIKEKMEEFYFEKGINNPSTVDTGRAFAYFYVQEILSNKYNLSDEEIEDGLNIDGKGDLGADYIFIKDNIFLIFQFKYKGKKNKVTKDEIAGFRELHERLLDKDHVKEYGNADIKYFLEKFNKKTSVNYFFVTNDEIPCEYKNTKTKSEKVDYAYVDLNEIWIEYKNIISQSRGVPEKVSIPIQSIHNGTKAMLDITKLVSKNTPYETVIVVIKGTQIKSMYEYNNIRDSLFTYNIRGYLGEKPVNKKIKKTIEEQPELFYYLNNGISAICTKYEIKEEGPHTRIECENFQIINGAQTVTTIAKMDNEYQDNLNSVQVIMRITKAEDLKTQKKGINREIIKANNNQTAIKISDFRSNDDIQIFLEKELRQYSYKGMNPYQNIFYQPKRKYHKKKKSDNFFIIQIDTLSKLLYSFYYDPIKFQAKPGLLYDDSPEDGLYWKIFGNDDEEISFYEKNKVKEIASIIILWIHLQELIKEIKKKTDVDSIYYQATLAKWQIIYALGKIFNLHSESDKTYIINHILDGKLLSKNGSITKAIKDLINMIEDIISDEYDSDEESNKAFNLRNWMRSNRSIKKIDSRIERKKNRFKLTE